MAIVSGLPDIVSSSPDIGHGDRFRGPRPGGAPAVPLFPRARGVGEYAGARHVRRRTYGDADP
jgi:hypothetical protein